MIKHNLYKYITLMYLIKYANVNTTISLLIDCS